MVSKNFNSKIAGILLPAFIFLIFLKTLHADILDNVRKLKIGINGYYIGYKLKNYKKLTKINKVYKGTEKYKDKDIYITVSKNEKIILGIYKKIDNATYDDLKKTISFLMINFGDPTIEAHGKNIYWFYSEKGKVSNKEFLEARKKNKIKKPILMVKFNSNKFISSNSNKIKFYFIIYSEPLIKKLLNKN